MTLIHLVPAGTNVKKGEIVAELDEAKLRDELINQKIAVIQSKGPYESAKLDREAAELAVTEYVEGTYPQVLKAAKNKLSVAEGEREKAEKTLTYVKDMVSKGIMAPAQVKAAELKLEKVNFKAEQLKTEKNLLEKYTKDKTVKKLQINVEKAKQFELAKKSAWIEQQAEQDRLGAQIKLCKIAAPVDGMVVYASEVEEGVDINKGDTVFLIIPDEKPKGTKSAP